MVIKPDSSVGKLVYQTVIVQASIKFINIEEHCLGLHLNTDN